MSPSQLLTGILIAAGAVSGVAARAEGQVEFTTITAAPAAPTGGLERRQALPLTQYTFPYSNVPYQVNPYPSGRGPQTGYNKCNSTTEGPNSMCQTLIVNTLSDFCLWGSPTSNGIVGNVEAEVVAYCAQKGHGTRQITPGSITAAQFIRTSKYIQVTGLIDQTGIGLNKDDQGGELDPHGADLAGNPLGGLVYSTNLPGGNNKTYIQSESWTNFLGSNMFCIKVCFDTSSPNYCENRYDTIGCNYNMPAAYAPNEFLDCDGDLQEVVGTYVTNGQTMTWDQNSGGDPPYTPVIPATSNCKTYQSTDLYPAATSTSSSSSSASTTGSMATSVSGSAASGSNTGSRTGTSSSPSSTSSGAASPRAVASLGLFAVLGLAVAFN